MSDNGNDNQGLSVSVPIGLVATGVLVGLATVAAYLASNRGNGTVASQVQGKAKSTKGFGKKIGLTTLITLLENDATRKVVLAVLKAMVRRS